MKTREDALSYGLTFPYTYQEAPFHDSNWQLIRVKPSKKAFLWSYEKDGQVAAMAGNPKMSRAVGNALHKNPDFENIPCYRVVNSKGELAGEYVFGGAWAQKELLEADGIVVQNGKVDLDKYGIEIE
ncbi:MAG: MGMT family protein [Pseudobutyrivibrio sp.]|nr:MGMT family protein [Pseudobutyrivibrio sp.]